MLALFLAIETLAFNVLSSRYYGQDGLHLWKNHHESCCLICQPEKTWKKHWLLEIPQGCRIFFQTFPSKHMSGSRPKQTTHDLFFWTQMQLGEMSSNCSEGQKSKYPQDLLNWVLSSCRIEDKCSSARSGSLEFSIGAQRDLQRLSKNYTKRIRISQRKPCAVQAKSCFNLSTVCWDKPLDIVWIHDLHRAPFATLSQGLASSKVSSSTGGMAKWFKVFVVRE